MRTAVVGTSVATLVAVAVQLALVARWAGTGAVVTWALLGAAFAANAVLLGARDATGLLAVRLLAGLTVAGGVAGVLVPLVAGGPDGPGVPAAWAVARGPSPVLGPLVIALPGVLTLVATIGHPAAWRSPHDAPTGRLPVVAPAAGSGGVR